MNRLLEELLPYRQWVVRRKDKIPLDPHTGQKASVTNPKDWSTFDVAAAVCAANPMLGLGFVLSADDPFFFVDLDHSDDPAIVAKQLEIYNSFPTYIERSPSGKGCHIIGKGAVPSGRRKDKVEAYSDGRYLTITFDALKDIPVVDCQRQLDELYAAMGGNSHIDTSSTVESQPPTQSDEWVLNAAASAANGAKFKQLWEGRFPEYPSQSEADQSLYNILAFYTDNAEQVIRLFLTSALGKRDKAKRKDIQKRHIKLAFDQKVSPAVDPNNFKVMPKVENVALPLQVEATRRMEIITVSDIEPENIDWLWEHFLPRKKLALLAGKSNAGKSMLACELTSVASRGGVWPDGSKCEHPGHILIWTSEDGIRDTVVPRLIAAGADLKRVHIITAVNDSKLGKLPFNPATDIPLLKQTVIENNDISLVVIDPIVSSVEGDMNQSNVVRKALESLVAFAEEVDCSVLGITHFKKNSEGQDPLERIIGSQAFHALPRVILVAGKDENSDRRAFAIAKGSCGRDDGGIEFSIRATLIERDIKTASIAWGEAIQGSARDILASVEGENSKESSPHGNKLENAKQFLETFLANGAAYTKDELNKNAKLLGISANTLTRAKDELGVICAPDGLGGTWKHRLPLKVNNTN